MLGFPGGGLVFARLARGEQKPQFVVGTCTTRIDLGRPFETLDGQVVLAVLYLLAPQVVVGHPGPGVLGARVLPQRFEVVIDVAL